MRRARRYFIVETAERGYIEVHVYDMKELIDLHGLPFEGDVSNQIISGATNVPHSYDLHGDNVDDYRARDILGRSLADDWWGYEK